MSGETIRADDFDDFILDDGPAMAGLGGMFAQQPGDESFPVVESGENAVLFDPASTLGGQSEFGDLREFSEDGTTSWDGHTLQPQEIGIPVESDGFDPLTAPVEDLIHDTGDLQLVDEESQLSAPSLEDDLFAEPVGYESGGEPAEDSPGGAHVLVDGHFPGSLQHGDGWESIELGGSQHDGDAREEPAWVGEDAMAAAAEGTGNEVLGAEESSSYDAEAEPAWDATATAEEPAEEPAESETFDATAEEQPEPEFAGAGVGDVEDVQQEAAPVLPMRRRWGATLAAAAAVLLVGTGAAIAVDPKLFGMESIVGPGLLAPAQDDDLVVATPRPVARPVQRTTPAPVPVQEVPDQAEPAQPAQVASAPVAPVSQPEVPVSQPRPVDPVAAVPAVVAIPAIDPVAVVEPTPVPEPEPAVPTAAQPAPVEPVAVAAAPAAAQPAYDEVVQRTIKVGDSLQVGGFVEPQAGTVATVAELTPGTSALAHLRNGNYFIGTVKAVDASMVTLKLDKGEVTIASADIRKVSKLGSAEFLELQRSVSGFVRLSNNNRLVGAILASVADDNIVLEMKSDRIILPRSAIDEIVRQPEQGEVRFDLGESEEKWLQDLAERQLRAIEKERADRANEARATKDNAKQD